MGDVLFEIDIPSDDDGYVLFRCPKCGEYFKIRPTDYYAEEVIEIHCPLCGLVSDNYMTTDVIELGLTMAENYAMNMIYDAFSSISKKSRNSSVKFKVDKPRIKEEVPLRSTIDEMEIHEFPCCKRTVKLRYSLIYCGSYCTFCGGKDDGSI